MAGAGGNQEILLSWFSSLCQCLHLNYPICIKNTLMSMSRFTLEQILMVIKMCIVIYVL